ncbi:hypothetical protein ACFL2H_08880, partial [Planctomycetota bacterium]
MFRATSKQRKSHYHNWALESLESRRLLSVGPTQTLLPPIVHSQVFTGDGTVVAASSRFHVSGKPGADFQGTDSGAVEVYDAVTHGHIQTLYSPRPSNNAGFGFRLAIEDEILAVGDETNTVYVYDLSSEVPLLQSTLKPST